MDHGKNRKDGGGGLWPPPPLLGIVEMFHIWPVMWAAHGLHAAYVQRKCAHVRPPYMIKLGQSEKLFPYLSIEHAHI